jgi:putative tryptophan/tyrosine transport system substrate-binding protein
MERRRLIAGLALGGLAIPLRGLAQSGAKNHIGFLGAGTPAVYRRRVDAFRAGLRELGHVEGSTIRIDYRWAEGRYERLAELATELVVKGVQVLVTHASPGVRAARQASSTIPIVVTDIAANPVANGIAQSLARPGGNVTGSAYFGTEFTTKRLELLKEALPRLRRVGWLINPDNTGLQSIAQVVDPVAKHLKVELQQFPTRQQSELAPAFAAMKNAGTEGVLVQEDPFFTINVATVADLASGHRLVSAGYGEFAELGGTIGYGVNFLELYRRAASFVDKILKGAKPGDLAFEQPTKYELVLNVKSAKALGITIPRAMLVRADNVIQ